MGLLDKLFKKENYNLVPLDNIDDQDIVGIVDGETIDVSSISDEVFAKQIMGKTMAFKCTEDKVILCSPANGNLTVLFPTGHAYGITMNNGVELLIHCGINTVETKGDGFKLLKTQGDFLKAGDPIVEVDIKKLSRNYDMSIMIIITKDNGNNYQFIEKEFIRRGEIIAVKNLP